MGRIRHVLRHGKGASLDPLQVGLARVGLGPPAGRLKDFRGLVCLDPRKGEPLVEGRPIRGNPKNGAFCEICVLESF